DREQGEEDDVDEDRTQRVPWQPVLDVLGDDEPSDEADRVHEDHEEEEVGGDAVEQDHDTARGGGTGARLGFRGTGWWTSFGLLAWSPLPQRPCMDQSSGSVAKPGGGGV